MAFTSLCTHGNADPSVAYVPDPSYRHLRSLAQDRQFVAISINGEPGSLVVRSIWFSNIGYLDTIGPMNAPPWRRVPLRVPDIDRKAIAFSMVRPIQWLANVTQILDMDFLIAGGEAASSDAVNGGRGYGHTWT